MASMRNNNSWLLPAVFLAIVIAVLALGVLALDREMSIFRAKQEIKTVVDAVAPTNDKTGIAQAKSVLANLGFSGELSKDTRSSGGLVAGNLLHSGSIKEFVITFRVGEFSKVKRYDLVTAFVDGEQIYPRTAPAKPDSKNQATKEFKLPRDNGLSTEHENKAREFLAIYGHPSGVFFDEMREDEDFAAPGSTHLITGDIRTASRSIVFRLSARVSGEAITFERLMVGGVQEFPPR